GRFWRAREAIVEAGDIAKPRSRRDEEVTARQLLAQRSRSAEADMAGIEGRIVVEDILVFPGDRHRNALRLGEARKCRSTRSPPELAARDEEGAFGSIDELLQRLDLLGCVARLVKRIWRGQFRFSGVLQHIFRHRDDHGSGYALRGETEGAHD